MILAWLALSPWIGAAAVLAAPARWVRPVASVAALGVAASVAAAIVQDTAPTEALWLARGVVVRLGLAPLGLVGLATAALSLVLATQSGAGRGRLALILALHGVTLGGLLAQDAVVLAAAWALAPVLVAGLAAGEESPRARGAGRALALAWSLAAALLLTAAGGAMVALYGASGGIWSGALAELTEVRPAPGLALLIAGTAGGAASLALGLWPLHGWSVDASAGEPGGAQGLAALRWLGLDALVRVWVPLAPVGAAASAPVLAALATCGALHAGLAARAERDPRRRTGLVAQTAWSVAALGVATMALEGCVGALLLGVAGSLGQVAARRGGTLVRAAIGLTGVIGGALAAAAALRFADLTLGALGPVLAVGAAAAMWFAGVALVREAPGRGGAGELWAAGGAALAIAAPALQPGLLARPTAAAEAWVVAAARQRCLALEEPRVVSVRLSAASAERCDAALQGLRLAQARERERRARDGG